MKVLQAYVVASLLKQLAMLEKLRRNFDRPHDFASRLAGWLAQLCSRNDCGRQIGIGGVVVAVVGVDVAAGGNLPEAAAAADESDNGCVCGTPVSSPRRRIHIFGKPKLRQPAKATG